MMTDEEALEKIMKAADKYAGSQQRISDCHYNGTGDQYDQARRDAPKARWELEQMVKAALFAIKKVSKEA